MLAIVEESFEYNIGLAIDMPMESLGKIIFILDVYHLI
jgi:hypothetical protein